METLSEYDYILQHVPGHLNTMADLLSQHPDLKEGVKTVNDDITVLSDHLFINKITLPNDIIKRRKAVYELYDTPIAGHPGMANTWALVNQRCSKVHQQEHSLLPDFLLVPSRKVVQVAQVHKLNIGLLFNTNFNNINLFN